MNKSAGGGAGRLAVVQRQGECSSSALWRACSQHVRSQHVARDHAGRDDSGWLLHTRADLDDEAAYGQCASLHARPAFTPCEERIDFATQLGPDGGAMSLDAPPHPGVASWHREHASDVNVVAILG